MNRFNLDSDDLGFVLVLVVSIGIFVIVEFFGLMTSKMNLPKLPKNDEDPDPQDHNARVFLLLVAAIASGAIFAMFF